MKEPAKAELRLAEIVLTAAELEGAEREAYLRDLASSEPDLATEAHRRLAAAEELPNSFLMTSAAVRLGTATTEEIEEAEEVEKVEERASAAALPVAERYELGECLGEGGMGRVVKAFDRQLGRTVALKFLTHEDPEILRLFLGEARNQARVEHDHVLKIHDSGELDSRPFIAMHHVALGTLAEVGATLPLEGKVRLLCQAAEGLHAAHRQGLLHRDVKPSNILVERTSDGGLRALVTDFGLATEVEDADSLADDAVAGSPQYIAPERLLGLTTTSPNTASPNTAAPNTAAPNTAAPNTVDRRSDIYSLGVTMYRLLTGELPFSGQNTMEILRQVVLHDLPPPRQRMPELPVELEAIILRSIASAPEERYASARAVAEDLRRFLDGEVVEAYAASLAYRLTRFVLRNKVLVGMAAAAVMVLVASSLAVAVFALRADAARQRAEVRQGQAEELIHFMVFDLRDKLETLGRLDILTDLGDAAREYFAAVPAAELSEAELLRRSRMLYQIGDVRIRQGDLAGAAAPMAESLVLARRLAELKPDDGERLFELGQAYFWIGFVSWEQGDLAEARGPFEEYLKVSRRLVDKDPANLDWRQELSYAHSNLGSLLKDEGNLGGALGQFLATLAIDEELVEATLASGDAQSELAATHNTVGVVLRDLGRLHEAGEHFSADLKIRHRLLALDTENPRAREFFGTSHARLGSHLSILGDWQGAEEHFQTTREIFTKLVEHDPSNAPWKFKLAWSHLHLGRVAYVRGDLESADRSWALERQLIDELLAHDTTHAWRRTRAVGLYHLALLKVARASPARAEVLSAVEILEELAASRPADRTVHRWLSQSYLLLGSLEESPATARSLFERAEETAASFANGSRDGRVLAPWATALHCLGRFEEARPAVETLDALGYSEPGLANLCQGAQRGKPESL